MTANDAYELLCDYFDEKVEVDYVMEYSRFFKFMLSSENGADDKYFTGPPMCVMKNTREVMSVMDIEDPKYLDEVPVIRYL